MDAKIGDAELERLLSHSEWLTLIAQRLVRDPAAADDLVQDTWHAALRGPRVELESERGWLATLIANLARVRVRAEVARRERERSCAASEGIDGPDALVERAESQRRLLAHVLELAEPYRGTLLARYVEGRSAAEIARRTGVNESTVRTRLSRALEQLRARLAGESRKDRLFGLGALVRDTGAGQIGASVATGVSIMGAGTKLGVAAVILIGAWLGWRGLGSDKPQEAEISLAPMAAPESMTQAPDHDGVTRTPEPFESPFAETQPTAPSAAKPPDALKEDATLEILVTRDDVPQPGLSLRIIPYSGQAWNAHLRGRTAVAHLDLLDVHFEWPSDAPKEVTDSRGIATFIELPQAKYFVGWERTAAVGTPKRINRIDYHTGQRFELRLGSAQIHGHVFDERGRARADVGVMVSPRQPDPKTHGMLTALATTDGLGAYRIGELWATDWRDTTTSYDVVLEPDGRFDGRGEVQQKIVELRAGEVRELDFGSSLAGPRWSARLLNAFEEPFAGTPRLVISNDLDKLTAPVDASGSFLLAYTPGRWRVHAFAAGCPDSGFDLGTLELPATDFPQDLIVPGTRVQGRTSAARAGESLPAELNVTLRPKDHDYPAAFRDATTTKEGTYSIDGISPGEWRVGVWPGALETPVEITVREGARTLVQDLRWVAN